MGRFAPSGYPDWLDGRSYAPVPDVSITSPDKTNFHAPILCLRRLLASKRNPIALLLDCSHEQLQVFHRWAAFFMLLLGLIHGFVFIRRDIAAGMLSMDWSTNFFYWTGVATIVPQIWLTLMSLAPIRNMFYEFFKLTHRLIAAIFVVFFFLHCGRTLTAWDYFYALAAFYVPSVAARIILIAKNRRALIRSPSSGYAHLRVVAENLLEIRVPQSQLRWHGGQHFFVRFTGLDWITGAQSHPLTAITSSLHGNSDIVALAKVGDGELGRLALLASVQEKETLTCNVWLDGPYGRPIPSLAQYDRILLLGAGSGLTYVASIWKEAILRGVEPSHVHLVATCSHVHQLGAYLAAAMAVAGEGSASKSGVDKEGERALTVLIDRHVTAGGPASADVHRSRPDVRLIIRREARELCHSRLAIVACGPQQFMRDIAAEVSALQWEIMTGRSSLTEVYYRSEAYHW
jgi:predicted ferric reductase